MPTGVLRSMVGDHFVGHEFRTRWIVGQRMLEQWRHLPLRFRILNVHCPCYLSPTFDLFARHCTNAFETNPPSFVTFHGASFHDSILRASRVLQRSTCRPCARLVRHGHKGAGRANHKPYANLPSWQRAPPFPSKTWAVFRVGFSQGT